MNANPETRAERSLAALFDAYLFRGLGLLVGWGGVAAMLLNNRWGLLFANPYGLFFFAAFLAMGLYSGWSMKRDLTR
ncbi:MAG: hypothetical protein HQK87_08115 [Nitrospinae bacterium]|nr:hypothetical protein [Nitrospinota bacterium]